MFFYQKHRGSPRTVLTMFLLLLILVITGAALAKDEYRGHRLIRVQASTHEQAAFLRDLSATHPEYQLDFWTEPNTLRATTIRVPPKSFRKVQRSLHEAGMEAVVLREDIQSMVDEEAAQMAAAARSRSDLDYTTTYLNYEQVQSKLDELATKHSEYLHISRHWEKTFEGRQQKYVWISKDFSGKQPAVWIEAGTHAREWITVSVALHLIEKLASGYGTDDEVTKMLDKFDWYIVPVHNPDGYAHSHAGERLWRKNRHNQSGDCCWFIFCGYEQGTDLNRNWNINHGGQGSSPDCNSDTYHGGSAFSEAETRFLRDSVIDSNTDGRVKAFFSLHSYSQFMLLPYGFKSQWPSDYEELNSTAQLAMESLKSVYGTDYVIGTPPDILYVASGGAYDYFKEVLGIKYAYTYELRPESGSSLGFQLPADQIVPTMKETWASFVTFAELIN